jgi:hypothetical protein
MTNALLTLIIALLFKVLFELNENLYGAFYYIASIILSLSAVIWVMFEVVSQYRHRND